ncbi:hypothetical protein K5E_25730 [Enterococcus thailandicus]|uniref:hypothetical protein n=1 Tax=Enterococcus TaxID=1350 RepID=UPI0022E3F588|nr:hypothetical protein [Enterococcus thailandicus]GMC10434.1 hypothetical protein K5E_25730 [Enterococcus thailandicus]
MKKVVKVVFVGMLALLFLTACGSSEEKEEKNYESTNSSIKEVDTNQTAEFATIAEKHIKEIYGIDDLKMDLQSIKVTQFPDDKNAETGEEYKNVFNGTGDFTWNNQEYNFSLIYSKKDATNYIVLYLYSNLDTNKGIDTPLESDQ